MFLISKMNLNVFRQFSKSVKRYVHFTKEHDELQESVKKVTLKTMGDDDQLNLMKVSFYNHCYFYLNLDSV